MRNLKRLRTLARMPVVVFILLLSPLSAPGWEAGPTGWWTDYDGTNYYGPRPLGSGGGGGGDFSGMEMQMATAFGSMLLQGLLSGGSQAADVQAQQQQQMEMERQRLAEERQRMEQLRQEQQRLQRVQQASRLRNLWDSQDQEISRQLEGVLDVPLQSTDFFGIQSNPDPDSIAAVLNEPYADVPVDLSDIPALEGAAQGGAPASAEVVDLSHANPFRGQVDPRILNEGMTRARETWAHHQEMVSRTWTGIQEAPTRSIAREWVDWGTGRAQELAPDIAKNFVSDIRSSALEATGIPNIEKILDYGENLEGFAQNVIKETLSRDLVNTLAHGQPGDYARHEQKTEDALWGAPENPFRKLDDFGVDSRAVFDRLAKGDSITREEAKGLIQEWAKKKCKDEVISESKSYLYSSAKKHLLSDLW